MSFGLTESSVKFDLGRGYIETTHNLCSLRHTMLTSGG